MRTCTVCTHDDRDAVDSALVAGTPYRDIAARFSLSPSSLVRHRRAHVSPAIAAIAVERERDRGETLLDRVESLIDRTDALLTMSERTGKVAQALTAVRELRALLELLGKASGELKPDGLVQVLNVMTNPEWLAIRTRLLQVLAAHPDARLAVTGALAELEMAS